MTLRTVGIAAAIGIVLLVVLRPVVLGDGFSGLDLVTAGAVLVGAGVFLGREGGRTRTIGSPLLVVGLGVLSVGIAVLAFSVLWCCP